MQDLKEFVFILLVIAVFVAGVQWFLLRFTHWSIALAATAFISITIGSLYVALKHTRPNGGSSDPPASEFITPALIMFGVLLLGLWLVSYLTKNQIPKIAIILPLCLIIVFAIGRNVYEYIHAVSFYAKHFSDCEIELLDKTGSKSNVDVISFKNSTSGYSTDIHTRIKEKPYPQMVRFADTIIFRYYSIQTKKEFIQKFPFDYNLCKEKDEPIEYCFWLRLHSTLPMKIVLLPNEKVDLYVGEEFIKQYEVSDLETEDQSKKEVNYQ